MFVTKRTGKLEPLDFLKITKRLRDLSFGLSFGKENALAEVLADLTANVERAVTQHIKTTALDGLAAQLAAAQTSRHPDYGTLAARIAVSNMQKETAPSWVAVCHRLFHHRDARGHTAPLISEELYRISQTYPELDAALHHERDFQFSFMGYTTLESSYLLRINGEVVERPQHMWMRVAAGIHGPSVPRILETYELLSQGLYTHASPTLFNAGTRTAGLTSCFLLTNKADSIAGIFQSVQDCALISKYSGGIGLAVSTIRAAGSAIHGTGGTSDGIVPFLRVLNATARAVNQGGRRKGAISVYLEPWHADILAFLELRLATGSEDQRCRDLFPALWVPDLFMERIEADGSWSVMCPSECPGLTEVYGEEFKTLYLRYEAEGRAKHVYPARWLWDKVLQSQVESGLPYLLSKDAANRKSNQSNLGVIHSSNLCCEILEYSSAEEVACCNLASLALPKFVRDGRFDHEEFARVVEVVTRNLNRVIDRTHYPIPEARRSNLAHRPLGIGVQGLADVFALLGLPFESEGARVLNREIFETLYFAALTASSALAQEEGAYSSYPSSPAARGLLQPDLWALEGKTLPQYSGRWDWAALRATIARQGLRNSLLVAPMPTASTSSILGNTESFEPTTENLYVRRTLAGEFLILRTEMVKRLVAEGLWTDTLRQKIILHNGSVQGLPDVPLPLQELFRTVWEMKQKHLMLMAAERGCFIDQSQSMNLYMAEPTKAKLTAAHFTAWRLGLKTLMYYLRQQDPSPTIKFGVDAHLAQAEACRRDQPNCESCSA